MEFGSSNIKIFTVLNRQEEVTNYQLDSFLPFLKQTEKNNFDGTLLFESQNNLEPWIFAQALLSETVKISPFIAVNPVYCHPITIARKIHFLSLLYKRRLYINFITGTSKSNLASINDKLGHQARYQRLSEYLHIIKYLLTESKPFTFEGEFYSVKNLILNTKLVDGDLLPIMFIAGSSVDAEECRLKTGCLSLQMAKGEIFPTLDINTKKMDGIHFGIIARETELQAQKDLKRLFPSSDMGQYLLTSSMSNTDSIWKQELKESIDLKKNNENSTFCLLPFASFKSDCPYHVGSYAQIAETISIYIKSGYSTFIIEVGKHPDELSHIRNSFSLAHRMFK